MDVLLAVADEQLQLLADQVLTRAGATLHVANDPVEALSRFEAQPFPIIVFDVAGNDHHHQLLTIVRGRDPRPIVILTTSPGGDDSFDPNLIHYVVRRPYDVGVVVGVILASMSGRAV